MSAQIKKKKKAAPPPPKKDNKENKEKILILFDFGNSSTFNFWLQVPNH